jgi:hypothetical protein
MRNKSILGKTMMGVCLLAFPALVNADSLGTVDIYKMGHGANTAIDVWGGGLAGPEMYAGVYMLQKTADTGAGVLWPNTQLVGFCIEAEEPSYPTTQTYSVDTPEHNYSPILNETMGIQKANYLSELWGRYYDPSWAGLGSHTTTENTQASAFAAAIWEIVYEDVPVSPLLWNVNADGTAGIGGFSSLQADGALANSWLHSLDGTGPQANLAVFTNQGAQNFLVQVPEPTTVALFGLGGFLSIMRRRKHRTA